MLPQQDVPLSAAKSGFFIPAAVTGTAAAAAARGWEAEKSVGLGLERQNVRGEWREEGNKRRVLAGRQRAAWREEQVGPGPRVGRDVVGLGLLEARVG